MNGILKKKRNVYLVYTGLYCLLFFFCFEIYLLIYHKSILWDQDTYEMHYLQFLYFGRWIRNGLMTGEFPLWNPAFGYGADFLAGGISVLCDPLNWLAVLLPERFSEAGYHLVIFLRLYFCGLAFSWFGLRRERPAYAVLCGAVLYTFCAYAYLGLTQSGFLLALVALPLLIVGTDELFEKKKAILYVVVLSYCALYSFYLTYMLALLVIAYFLLKFCFMEKEERTFSHLLRLTGRFLLYSCWAAAIAAATLVPAALLISGMSRLTIKPYVPILYDRSFYYQLYKGIITSYNMLRRDGEIGFSVLAVICVFAFFLSWKPEKRKTAFVFVLMSVGLCIPYIGHVMNGFNYIANRWVWAYDFVVAWICTLTIPELKNLKKTTVAAVLGISVLYVFFAYTLFQANGRAFLVMSCALLLTGMLLFIFPRLPESWYRRLMVFLTCITVILPAYFQYSDRYLDWFCDNVPAGEAYERALQSSGMPLLNRVNTSDGSRYNSSNLPIVHNASWLCGVSGTDFYWNLYNSNIDDFHNSVALHTQFYNFGYEGLDRRSELLALLGVNHFFTDADSPELPVGFDVREAEMISGGRRICAYRPTENYSLFSLFRNTLSYEEYEKLTPIERQQALLQACVLKSDSASVKANGLEIENTEVPYRIAEEHGLTTDSGKFLVSAQPAKVDLSFAPQTDGEIFIYFENLVYENEAEIGGLIQVEALSQGEILYDMTQSLYLATDRHHMYGGKHNWILNIGRIPESIDTLRISFWDPGIYSYQAIRIYTRCTDAILENIGRLKRGAEQISFSSDAFSLTVSTAEEEYLFAAIPYDRGWRVTDNGEPIGIQRADVAFMAVKLEPGTHHLVFCYHNTVLTVSLIISFLAAAAYAAFEIGKQKVQKKQNSWQES